MPTYRDDTMEVLVVSDQPSAFFVGVTSDSLNAGDGAANTFLETVTDGASVSSLTAYTPIVASTTGSARAGDAHRTRADISAVAVDRAGAQDLAFAKFKAQAVGLANTSDSQRGIHLVITVGVARATQALQSHFAGVSKRTDRLKVKDRSIQYGRERVTDTLHPADTTRSKATYRAHTIVSLAVSASTTSALTARTFTRDKAHAGDMARGTLESSSFTSDLLQVYDTVQPWLDVLGKAVSANTVNWATSTYSAFGYDKLFVKAGVLHASGPAGIFVARSGDELVKARLTTRLADMAGDSLTLSHPTHAYLEYAKEGTLQVAVVQRQKGVLQEWAYALPQEVADELTNGRVSFGRGLRGRHYQFRLVFEGTHCRIDDFNIYTAATRRRI